MSIVRRIKSQRAAHRTSPRRGRHDLAWALEHAPTRASREELLQLQSLRR